MYGGTELTLSAIEETLAAEHYPLDMINDACTIYAYMSTCSRLFLGMWLHA